MLMVVSLTFFACENTALPELSCSGVVLFNDEPIKDVVIKSDVKNYAISSSTGEYSFTTKANKITIYPEKEGYIFTPESITIEAGENTKVNFEAIQVQNLEGRIKLEKIVITPIVISTVPDNFQFIDTSNAKKALKVKDIYVWCNNEPYLITQNVNYLYSQEENYIDVNKNLSFETGENFSIGVLMNTYFTIRGYGESSTSGQNNNSNYTYLYISKHQTNADLVNNKITYNLYGVNNYLRTITFNVSFIFGYIE